MSLTERGLKLKKIIAANEHYSPFSQSVSKKLGVEEHLEQHRLPRQKRYAFDATQKLQQVTPPT